MSFFRPTPGIHCLPAATQIASLIKVVVSSLFALRDYKFETTMGDKKNSKTGPSNELKALRKRVNQLEKLHQELEKTAAVVRDSFNSYKALADNADDGILITVSDGRHVYANNSAARITGYSLQELLKIGIEELAHPDELAKIKGYFQRRINGADVPSKYETAIVARDGRSIPVEMTGSRTIWFGQPASITVFHDIIERRESEAEIRKLSRFLEGIIDNANVWLDVLDEKANVLIWNKAAQEISGYARDEVVGHGKIWEWLYPEENYRRQITAKAAAIIEKGGGGGRLRNSNQAQRRRIPHNILAF